MALSFSNKATAVLKAKASSGEFITLAGYNATETSPTNAAAQANKILDIGGKSVVADTNMTLTQQKGVVEDE